MSKKIKPNKATTKSYELSRISKSGKKVEVYSGSTKSAKKSSGMLYGKMLSQESNDMKRLSKWHSRIRPKKATVSAQSNKVQKIKGFKRGEDGKIIGIEK